MSCQARTHEDLNCMICCELVSSGACNVPYESAKLHESQWHMTMDTSKDGIYWTYSSHVSKFFKCICTSCLSKPFQTVEETDTGSFNFPCFVGYAQECFIFTMSVECILYEKWWFLFLIYWILSTGQPVRPDTLPRQVSSRTAIKFCMLTLAKQALPW